MSKSLEPLEVKSSGDTGIAIVSLGVILGVSYKSVAYWWKAPSYLASPAIWLVAVLTVYFAGAFARKNSPNPSWSLTFRLLLTLVLSAFLVVALHRCVPLSETEVIVRNLSVESTIDKQGHINSIWFLSLEESDGTQTLLPIGRSEGVKTGEKGHLRYRKLLWREPHSYYSKTLEIKSRVW